MKNWSRCLLALMTGALLLLLQACVEKVHVRVEDISGHIWLKSVSEAEEIEGFYAATDGQLQLINSARMQGVRWEVYENQLLLWVHYKDRTNLRALEYYPLLIDEKLLLSTSSEPGSPLYFAGEPQDHLDNVHYYLTHMNGAPFEKPAKENSLPYLQLDAVDKSLRGYAGVNNFYGHYIRTGATGFKAGPLSATKMSGPEMNHELKFMQCLDQADSFLAVRKELLFYQGTKVVCSFRANSP